MAPTRHRDGWVSLGITISAASAAVSSFSGLHSLAVVTGWHDWLAPLVPFTIDAYAMTATRVWLAESTRSHRARRFARWNAVGAIVLSLCGNAVWHLIAAGLLAVSWLVVLVVGAVPPVILGLVSHLALLRTQTDPPRVSRSGTPVPVAQRPQSGLRPDSGGQSVTRYRTEAELLAAARAADADHRKTYGRPISRDALRRELRVGGARASAILRLLKEGREPLSIPHHEES